MLRAYDVRKAIDSLPGAWVRVYKDGQCWAGARGNGYPTGETGKRLMLDAKRRLEAAGYRCECNGKPGTSGEFIIEVFEA